jgi:pimeloyl-ACP methyl ester carboxylesterase
VLAALSAQHDVHAWSLPGHFGGQPWDPAVPFTMSACVDVVERQLDSLDFDRVHLAGNSLGGWLALELAARGRARSVVGVCPAGGWDSGGPDERRIARYFRRNEFLLRHFERALPFVARHALLRRIALRDVVADGRRVSPAAALALFEGARQCAVVDEVLSLVSTGVTFDLGPIDCPVRILYGSKDRLLRWPDCYRGMQRMLPAADWMCLEGLGHLPMWDSPEVVTRAILEHTRRASGQTDAEPTLSA